MLTLIRHLPFIVGALIPEGDKHWACFLLLRKIVDIIMSPILPESISATLCLLIQEHHSMFVALYGKENFILCSTILLKFLMLAQWFVRGPCAMSFFKKASRLANFKNVAQSVVNRHQRWFCYQLASSTGFLDPMLECGPSVGGHSNHSLLKEKVNSLQTKIVRVLPGVSLDSAVFRPTWVRREGVVYKANNCFLISGSDGLDPLFVKLDELLVISGNTLLFVVMFYISMIISMLMFWNLLQTSQ